jgi:hypothetical protein
VSITADDQAWSVSRPGASFFAFILIGTLYMQ